ncbi:ankyrin repeat domain-containing protein [Qipengyuania sp. DGS5-3]|uniref:ankyrin repeat domain-containing protein n=1 Tax=Qipengyuania sp. DGS5-3 TaxID=3349632 RepID=UPI0036D41211
MRPFLSNGEGGKRIYDAVLAGDVDEVGAMVARNPRLLATSRVLQQGERASDGNTGGLLSFAIANCDARMLGALLELGADPDGIPAGTPLTYALLADEPLMATMLLQAGAAPDAHEPGSNTPLREVLYFERADAVSLLARAGANVNHSDAVGGTPLEAAISFGDYASAEILMIAGANPWQVANKGALPATMLTTPAKDASQDPLREKLLASAKAKAPIWPPPSQAEVQRQFASGAWPNSEMTAAGMVASPAALTSIRQAVAAAR